MKYLDKILSKYKVRDLFSGINQAYSQEVNVPQNICLSIDILEILRGSLRKKEADYLVDSFLGDLSLGIGRYSPQELILLVSEIQEESEKACVLKALQRRKTLTGREIENLSAGFSKQTKQIYNL